MARGGTVAEVRVALATSDETRGVVGALYRDVLGRAGDVADQSDDVRANLAGSDEAGQAVGALYEAVLGRDGDAPAIVYWQGDLAGSLSLDNVRTDLASSDEVGQAVGDSTRPCWDATAMHPGSPIGSNG